MAALAVCASLSLAPGAGDVPFFVISYKVYCDLEKFVKFPQHFGAILEVFWAASFLWDSQPGQGANK